MPANGFSEHFIYREAHFQNTVKFFLSPVKNYIKIVRILALVKIHFEQVEVINKRLVISLNERTHKHLGMYYSHDPQIFKLKGVKRKQSEGLKTNEQLLRFQINPTLFITMFCKITAMVVS